MWGSYGIVGRIRKCNVVSDRGGAGAAVRLRTDSMPGPLVRTTDLHKSYGSVSVLKGVTFEVAAGERVAILGKSGSGKSTLLHLIGGLDVPTSGTVTVAGRNLGQLSRNERAEFRLTTVGIIFQAFHLIPNRSAVENVELPMTFAARSKRERQRQAI